MNNFLKKPLDFLVKMEYSINKMKNMKNKNTITRTRLTTKERQELNEKDAKHTWYLELAIAACIGASLALAFVVGHQMLTTNWTW